MDWKDIETKWDQFKGKVREQWGKLTDDDIDRIHGRRDQLEAKLRERYGYKDEDVGREIDRFVHNVDEQSIRSSNNRGQQPHGM